MAPNITHAVRSSGLGTAAWDCCKKKKGGGGGGARAKVFISFVFGPAFIFRFSL